MKEAIFDNLSGKIIGIIKLPETLRKAIKTTDIRQTAYVGFKANTKMAVF